MLKPIFCFLLFVLTTVFSYSQNKPILKATVDKNSILIGEPFHLTVELTSVPIKAVRFLSIDTIPHFEFLEKGSVDSSTINNNLIIKQEMLITSFDSGRWVIPAFTLPGSKNIRSDTIGIDVGFTPFDRNKDYNDIKEIIEVPVEEKKETWYWYAALSVVLLIVIIYLLRKKKPKALEVQSPVDPYKEAMKELEQLQKENLAAKGEIKMYYSKLVDIFRFYVFRQKKIMSLQKTMDDLIIQLKSLKMSQEEYNKLAQSLRLADFVKFAKFIPSGTDNEETFTVIKNSIRAIETNK